MRRFQREKKTDFDTLHQLYFCTHQSLRMDMRRTYFVLFLGMSTILLAKAFVSKVSMKYGAIYGNQIVIRATTIHEYLGVPYAKPPTGDLRFKKPQPICKFQSPLNARQMPPACPQFKTVVSSAVNNSRHQSEDCLYLNIWVPQTSERKSVMYWIYGGGFAVGGNRLEINNGKVLAATGHVIVVTVNYRMNALGFLYSGTEDAPGNVGLYDVLLGLKWVKSNIAAFGGDPDNITIFGQSAGSIIVGTLAVSPLAKGLFNRAIMESGASTYLEGNNITKNMILSQEVAKGMSCANDSYTIFDNPNEVVSCLRNTDAHELAKVTAMMVPDTLRVFQPQYGDDIVPKNTRQAVIDGDFNDMDLMIGDTTQEGSAPLVMGSQKVFGSYGEKNVLFNKSYARQVLQEKLSELGNIDPIMDYYLGSSPDSDYEQIRTQTFSALGDKIYVCPDIFFAERYVERGNRVYFYYFAHRPSTSKYAPWMGVTHFSEVQFVFGQPISYPLNYTKDEIPLSLFVMHSWSNFTKTGKPGNEWSLYTTQNPAVLRIDSPNKKLFTSVPQPNNCDVYRSYFGFEK